MKTSWMSCGKAATIFAIAVAALWKPFIAPGLFSLMLTEVDNEIGTITMLEQEELRSRYKNKHALLIGGTRGVGYGTALAMAKAGAHITLVGRSEKSGNAALKRIREALVAAGGRGDQQQQMTFIQGDLGTVRSTYELIETLTSQEGSSHYDFLFISAATFPNWDAPLLNEDGLDKSYFIAVAGRFLVYRNMHRFLNDEARVLNVLAPGSSVAHPFDRDIASGKTTCSNLFESLTTFGAANDMMLLALKEKDENARKTTIVTTHPGFLKTDLHRGQGLWFDIVEQVFYSLFGSSEEDTGLLQANILVSERLYKEKLSIVDFMGTGRIVSTPLQLEFDANREWLWSQLLGLELKKTNDETSEA